MKTHSNHFLVPTGSITALALAFGASGALAEMITPVAATAWEPATEGVRDIARTIDGSGLTGPNLGNADWTLDADAPTHPEPNTAGWGTVWEATYNESGPETQATNWAAWDLGATRTLTGMRVYNVEHSGPGPNGLFRVTLSADILVSSMETPGNPIDDPGNWTMIADDLDLEAATDVGVFKDLGNHPDVRWVAWADIVANEQFKDCCANDAHYVQLQEIRFFSDPGVAGDSDGDGLTDAFELAHTDPPSATALEPGADLENGGVGDGLTNLQEQENGTDPNDPDSDDDTLEDGPEVNGTSNAFDGAPTDPNAPDSDNDGLDDFEENGSLNTLFGSAPTNPNSADSDGDMLPDRWEIDNGLDPNDDTGDNGKTGNPDNDPFDNLAEFNNGTDPQDPEPASTMITPVAATAWEPVTEGVRDIARTIDGSGLTGDNLGELDWRLDEDAPIHPEPNTAGWNTVWEAHYNESGAELQSNNWAAWDLGGNFDINGMRVWNVQNSGPGPNGLWRETITVDVWVSSVESPGNPIDNPENWSKIEEDLNVQAGPSEIGVFKDLTPTANVRWVAWAEIVANEQFKDSHGNDSHYVELQEIRFFTGAVGPPLQLRVAHDTGSGDLSISWDSKDGKLYNLRSATDPAPPNDTPADWPIHDGNQDLVATPPENTVTFSLPGDAARFFVVEEFPAPPAVVFSENFDAAAALPAGWTTGDNLGDTGGTAWEVGNPSAVGPPAAHSAPNCAATNLAADYGADTDIYLRTPAIDLPSAAGATLRFHHFYDIEEIFDFGMIKVLDAGNADSELAVLEARLDGIAVDWEEATFRLPAGALGKSIKIEFSLFADDIEYKAGWYLDDVTVTVP